MPRRTRWVLGGLIAAAAVSFAVLGIARYWTFHNVTFDLAFYTRMAWGMVRGQFWDPILNAHVLGLHVSALLFPLGLLGAFGGLSELLIVTQAVALAGAAWPLASMAWRRGGSPAAIGSAVAYLLYPTLSHVASYEFHPGSVAVLPLAWLIDALDDERHREFVWASVAVIACREDLALVIGLAGVLALSRPVLRPYAKWIVGCSLAWFLLFALVLHPVFAPPNGSMTLHFGRWGETVPEAAWAVVRSPGELWVHLTTPRRLAYLPWILLPLLGLPLLRVRFALLAAPLLALNLLSDWPTTTALDSHYTVAAVPMLVAAAIDGAARLQSYARMPWSGFALLGGAALVTHMLWGQTPLSAAFESDAFRSDPRSRAAAEVVARIPAAASVQAPYALMAHLAERTDLAPPPPRERRYDYVVLDAWHRAAFRGNEDLLRTSEEPNVRRWLARPDHELVWARSPFLLLRRGGRPRGGVASRYLRGQADPEAGVRLAQCLRLLGAELTAGDLVLDLVATGPCPSDLAVRLGTGRRPRRVELLFDGLLNPAHVRAGDRLVSRHQMSPSERQRWSQGALRVGLLRSSGARPEHADPVAVPVVLGYESSGVRVRPSAVSNTP